MPEEAKSGLGSVGPVFCHSLRVVWTLGACLVELWSATTKQPTPSSNISSKQRPLDRAYTFLVSPSSCPVIPPRRSRPFLRALFNVEPENCRKRELGRCLATIGQRTQPLPFPVRLFLPLLALQQAPFVHHLRQQAVRYHGRRSLVPSRDLTWTDTSSRTARAAARLDPGPADRSWIFARKR